MYIVYDITFNFSNKTFDEELLQKSIQKSQIREFILKLLKRSTNH